MNNVDRNPYAPPEAKVSDLPAEAQDDASAKPAQVTVAVGLSLSSLILGLVVGEWEGPGFFSEQMSTSTRIVEVIGLCTVLAVILAIARRRSWARTVFCVMAGLGLLPSYLSMFAVGLTRMQGINLIVQTILCVATGYLLFSEPARSWFDRAGE